MKKHLKRISSVLLAFVISLSLVLPVYAEEETITEQIEITEEAIEEAQEATEEVADQVISDNLEDGAEAVEVIETNVGIVLDANTEIATDISNLETVVSSVENEVNQTFETLDVITNKEQPINDNGDSAITNAKIANTTSSQQEAYQAKDNAVADLVKVEKDWVNVENAYNQASKDLIDLQNQYQNIETEKAKIQEKIDNATTALTTAQTNSAAAVAALKAAQDRLKTLQDEQNVLSAQKDDLQAIQEQYYAMMVYYYRDLLGNNVAYNQDGSLDLDENATRADANRDNKAKNPNKEVMKLNRNLMEKLIKFMVTNNGADANSIEFALEGKDVKETADGDVFTNNKGQDQTKLTPTEKQRWDNVSGENGRNNHVTVKYVDKNGQPVTEYYNYIFKDSTYQDKTNLEAGPIYLALVKYNDTTKKWEAAAVNDNNNYDDYVKLTKTLQAINDLKDYSEAKAAVDTAKAEVDKLDEELKKLQILQIDDERIAVLKSQIEEAQQTLEQLTETKDALEEKVIEARKAVAGIDLSRFNIRVDDEDEDDEPAEGGSSDATPTPAIIPTGFVLPTVPSTVTLTDGSRTISLAPVFTEDGDVDGITLEDSLLPAADAPTILFDDELPAAAELPDTLSNFELPSLNWLWLLALLILIILIIYLWKKEKEDQSGK